MGVSQLLQSVNTCVGAFGLGQLYTAENHEDAIHVSIGWCLSEPSLEERNKISGARVKKVIKNLEHPVVFPSVKVKIGNVVTAVEFGNRYSPR